MRCTGLYLFGCWAFMRAAMTASSAFAGCVTQDCEFVSHYDGTTQRYVLVSSADMAADGETLMLVFHGAFKDRWQCILDWGGEYEALREFAAGQNMILCSPDYRAPCSWFGLAAEADVMQLVGDLKARYGIQQTIACGASMGGAAALTMAARHPDAVQGVVSLNGIANYLEYTNFVADITKSFGCSKQAGPLVWKERSAEYYPERLTMPVAFTAGRQDAIVPPDSVFRLAGVLGLISSNPVNVMFQWTKGGGALDKQARGGARGSLCMGANGVVGKYST